MHVSGRPSAELNYEAQIFINLYQSLGERAENFLPDRIFESLTHFVRLCYEESDDSVRQQQEINKKLLDLKEAIPGYVDVSLMIFPHENSKAFEYSAHRGIFVKRMNHLMDIEAVDEKEKQQIRNILNGPDFSVGTPPVSQHLINFQYKILLGDKVRELRKFRDVIGVNGYVEEAQWNYLLDVLDQMVVQSTHYTTKKEKENFLTRTESTVNFKGLNGFIRTLVSGTADTAIKLIREEIFEPTIVRVIDFTTPDEVYEKICEDTTSIFIVKVKNLRRNPLNDFKWFPLLTRIIFVDCSPESIASNTCLVFSFHNEVINTLNKVHTKKLGAPANTQMNLRLILDKVNSRNLEKFRVAAEAKIKDYEEELAKLKSEQLAEPENPDQDIILYKFDEFARQIIIDKYILSKLVAFISFIENIKDGKLHAQTNATLLQEFEIRMKDYFYGSSPDIHLATVVEGGGRNQIKTYGEYLLHRKLKGVKKEVTDRCRVILDILPDCYQRTLHNHFHKNFGLNLFLEKYKEHLTKVENEADSKGRFRNLLIDLGIEKKYKEKSEAEQQIIKEFISGLGNLEKTSISDDVQMIIRDLVLNQSQPKPFIFLNQQAAWEYNDLFPIEEFDLNSFDIEIELDEQGRIDYERFLTKLQRIKSSFQLFDETGSLWDRFCANSTILINDPSNPTGYTDFNEVALIRFLKFISNTQFTIFLDEAYNDSVKIDDPDEPKWRTISSYIISNIATYPRISMVASLSTTKNLGATGDRLGALATTDAKKELIAFTRKQTDSSNGNSNSLFLLVNILEVAQQAKRIKCQMDEALPKDASRHKVKQKLENFIKAEIQSNVPTTIAGTTGSVQRESLFEGSPLHIFLLDELVSLDKLDVLELPDDFKYKGEAFFSYYKKHIVRELNQFRVNRIYRSESRKRLSLARKVATKIIEEQQLEDIGFLQSQGAYLFNLTLNGYFSYQDLEKFTKKLAEERGIAALPYQMGFVRFSLGDYVEGTEESYKVYSSQLENSFHIFIDRWMQFKEWKDQAKNKDMHTDEVLEQLFASTSSRNFVKQVLNDFEQTRDLSRRINVSLKINDIKTLYHAFPDVCGVSINSIGDSSNAVFEFYENVGECRNLIEFLNSQAFSKVYENLLPQIYKKVTAIKHLDINEVIARYGKPTVLKYVNSKLEFQPDSHLLDEPDEKLIMTEILMELERILFSDSKVKMLVLNANEKDPAGDLAKLEGYNTILRKYIREILLHFNLPFEKELIEPSKEELFQFAVEKLEEISGRKLEEVNYELLIQEQLERFAQEKELNDHPQKDRVLGYLYAALKELLAEGEGRLFIAYLVQEDKALVKNVTDTLNRLIRRLEEHDEADTRLYVENLVPEELKQVLDRVMLRRNYKVEEQTIIDEVRMIALFLTGALNRTRRTNYYNKFNHFLIKLLVYEFSRQNSSVNEMIQHGFTLYKDFEMEEKSLYQNNKGQLSWINDLMTRCGVIAAEKPVQTHTRMNTDAKKREYPFHKIDRTDVPVPVSEGQGEQSPREFIKNMSTRPSSDFFTQRMAKFIANMDTDDYRCRIVKGGLVNELYVFQKSYMKYLADNYRLNQPKAISLKEAKNFVPDIVLFLGAPEKVISYPQIGYFDLKGPKGNIKTIVTPLKKSVDYFGDVKKPRLTMLNEKVKEMGGAPVHGSFFIVEGDDGSLFGLMISGDSGVGKSEMLAAMMLKWLKKDLPGVRSIKLVAGDMLHLFPDTEGNLYGVGTEIGDFSRVTDFDPEYIRQYRTLFESSADSNVEDLNSRSTIAGFCDISMPFKVDIMLTAHNYSRNEAGITKYSNVENFMLYRDAHGERKEKATSSDHPHFQRTLLRYTADRNIVEVLDQHGNYLDDVLDWEKDAKTGKWNLASSYKMIEKIDVEEVVNKIFAGKKFKRNGVSFQVENVRFDIIKNRFVVAAKSVDGEEESNFLLDKLFFSEIFNSLASTPGGNPFIHEDGELEIRKNLIHILKGGKSGNGKGKNIQCAILSTDLGKKGKEITGPQKAAQDVRKLIQEVRNANPEIHKTKNLVKKEIEDKYGWLFKHHKKSLEVERYNFFLYQMEQMRKARFTRVDNARKAVDLSMLDGYQPLAKNHVFHPLLVTPNINIELNNFTETYEQLMWLPNNQEFAEEFYQDCEKLFMAKGYSEETIINNMIVQLLLMNGYIAVEDLSRGKITEKANRETIAAAKYAVICKYREEKEKVAQKPKASRPQASGRKPPKPEK
jgi:aspartate/methionine/tyrosine aminotransferase